MKIIAEPVPVETLEEGDIFHLEPPEQWPDMESTAIVGRRVFIRTEHPLADSDIGRTAYKISVEKC